MPIEPMEGARYIADLNEKWPLGSDEPSSTDDHLRGIKNILKNTFPNLTGPVTGTQDDLNATAIPSGSTMLFYQKNPPAGWSRATITNDYLVRVIKDSSSVGGTTGGTDNPKLNNKVPVHTHRVSGNTSTESATHNHSGSIGSDSHTHTVSEVIGDPGGGLAFGSGRDLKTKTTSSDSHSHSVTINSANANHNHSLTITSDNNTGSNATDWEPRHVNVIVCTKD